MEITQKERQEIVKRHYNRGLKMGIVVTSLIFLITIAIILTVASNRLIAEAKATNYYYSLTN